jgi:hypothetical protein
MAGSPFETVIPRHATLKHIVDRYGPLAEEIPCGLQNCRTKNGHGFLVAFIADGIEDVGAIGHICGRNHFGTVWVEQEKVYREKEKAKAISERLQRFLPEADRVLFHIQGTGPQLLRLCQQHELLATNAPKFFKYCADAARMHDGWVGKYAGNSFVREFRIEGADFFIQDIPLTAARVLKYDIERVQSLIQQGKLPDDELAARANEIGNIAGRWETIASWITTADKALSCDNLARVTSAYAERVKGFEIRVSINRKWLLTFDYRKIDSEHRGWVRLFPLDANNTSSKGESLLDTLHYENRRNDDQRS